MPFIPPDDAPVAMKYIARDDIDGGLFRLPLGYYTTAPKKDEDVVWIRCPLCGGINPCSLHTATGVGTDHLTLSPSMMCAQREHHDNPCNAHYFIEDGRVCKWQNDSRLPPKGFQSNY